MTVLRISQAGTCPRRLQLEAWGVEGLPLWEGSERAFEEGRLHEPSILEWAAQNLPDAPLMLHSQQKEVRATDFLVGHIDAIGASHEKRVAYLLEAKCLARKSFQELREKGVKESHLQYYTQVQLYLHALQCAGIPVKAAYLVARNKETPKTRMWEHHYELIEYDRQFCMEEIDRLRHLLAAIECGGIVPAPYHPDTDWHCRPPYCPYTYHCWPDWERKKPEIISREDLISTIEEYVALGEEIAALEDRRSCLKEQLFAACNSQPVQAGRWLVRVVERRQERFDTKLARKELSPDVLAKLLKVTTYRQLEVKEVI